MEQQNNDLAGHPLATALELAGHSPDDDDLPLRLPAGLGGLLERVHTNEYEHLKDLHPYSQILGLADVESCLKLEETTFPPHQRCTREKFIYRLSKCSELCLGLFTSAGPDSPDRQAATAATANAPDSNEPKRKGVLLAHLIATKTTNDLVKDEDMEMPQDWEQAGSGQNQSRKGHKEQGRTLAIHSLAVLPDYQKRGLGTILMKAYVQRMVESEVADKIALLTYDRLIPYYERLGFENMGKSDTTFGGETWNDMVLDFMHIRQPEED